MQTDALVIGAGPVGLFQAFQLGLLGLSVQIVDALPQAGGQCVELYADKPILDIPGIVECSGRELTERLLTQLAPLAPGWHLGHEVTGLTRRDDGRFDAVCADGTAFDAGAVFVCAGVGAFQPRRLKAPGLAGLEGRHLHYHPATDPAALARFAGRRVLVIGGDEAALLRAAALAGLPDQPPVQLMHRRDVLQADAALLARIDTLRQTGRLVFHAAQLAAARQDEAGRLLQVDLTLPDGSAHALALDELIVCQGLSPRLGPIADWGLAMERKLLVVDPATFSTSVPGIHAAGDIVSYPGKKKLILCGFHEATLAAHAAHERLRPHERGPLLYTSSSAVLQQRLGRG
ncbi:MAG: hypothetical protein RLZZ592_1880 [Pseudomonadota bacterium]|jgi:thioredoxin reductase (NADPH)